VHRVSGDGDEAAADCRAMGGDMKHCVDANLDMRRARLDPDAWR
jgi:hypothetical protein